MSSHPGTEGSLRDVHVGCDLGCGASRCPVGAFVRLARTMKIALVVPPISLQERYYKALVDIAGSLPPLGLLSIGAVLKRAGHDVRVLDGSVRSSDDMLSELARFSPRLVGITALTVMWPKLKVFSRALKEMQPGINIIVGGVHACLIKERALSEVPSADAVCWGEGEFAMLEYADRIMNPSAVQPLNGLAFRSQEGEMVVGPDREPIRDIDSLPLPDRSLVPIAGYVPAIEQYKKLPVTNMFTTRGCPFRCTFCLPDILGKGMRQRSVDRVLEEIEVLETDFGIRDIAFWDDTFTVNKRRVADLCERLLQRKRKTVWSAQARADCVTPDMLGRMARAGCWKVFYGVESLVQKNLDVINKGETVDQIFRAIEWTRKAGIETEASFMFGIPGETFEDGLQTIRLAKKLDPDYAKFFYFTPYGDLQQDIRKYGTLVTEREENFMGSLVTFVPHSMTKEELHELYRRAYREFYFRPRVVYRRLKKIGSPLEFKKSVKGLFALRGLISTPLDDSGNAVSRKQAQRPPNGKSREI
jgi:anaerobic magnesium-protoporphyrin IX monomethyl ester cyclase